MPPEILTNVRQCPRLASAYPTGMGLLPAILYRLKFENWPKKISVLWLILPEFIGESHQNSPSDLSLYTYKNFGSKFWSPSPPKILEQKISVRLAQLRDLIRNISGTQQHVVNRKTALQAADTTTHANLIWCLVHQRRKMGPKF